MVAAKSTSDAYATKPFPPDPNSQQSTVSTVEREIREAGGQAHAIAVDTREFESVQKMVDETVKVGYIQKAVWTVVDMLVDLRPPRCPHLQFRGHLVGVRGEYTDEEVSAYATD